jgi:pseudaminic acid cytidylyltransferase
VIVAIIPARGGSKRIPQKNIRSFAGKPIIGYSIAAAHQAGLFDRVIVSTDSEEIAAVASACGAEVPFRRPAELADDHTGTTAVLLHALEALEGAGQACEAYCCIYATSPFIRPSDLRRGYELLCARQASTVFSVTTFPYPVSRALRVREDGRVEMFWPQHLDARSQDLPEAYHDAGQFYWGRTERLKEERRLFTADSYPVVLPRYLVQDIDTPEDWATAERMFDVLRARKDLD